MRNKSNIEDYLEELRQQLPEPFVLSVGLQTFFAYPAARQLLADGKKTVRRILACLKRGLQPALVRVAVLLLSRFAPVMFYRQLLKILGKAGEKTTRAFEPGIWLIAKPERQIARDIVRLVAVSDNPSPLLLLQRPLAKEVRSGLKRIAAQRRLPHSLYALYCCKYGLARGDIPFLAAIAAFAEIPEMSVLAGLYLLELGSTKALPAIRAGLAASQKRVRTMTYSNLSAFLPETVARRSGYEPGRTGKTQGNAMDQLINYLNTNLTAGALSPA